MDHAPSDYHHGDMNIAEQTATYQRFGALSKWAALVIATGILMFGLMFCTSAGFLGSVVPAVVVLTAGSYFLRSKLSDGH